MLIGSDHVRRLRHRVADVPGATEFLRALGFEVVAATPAGCTLANGACELRLEAAPRSATVSLEIATRDLAAAAAGLGRIAGVEPLAPPEQPDATRFEQRFEGPFGIELVVVRELDLDEQGVELPVPTTVPWAPEALALLRDILRFVPLDFRRGALARSAGWAESRALAAGGVEVGLEDARASLLATTPDFQRERLRAELARWPEARAEGLP